MIKLDYQESLDNLDFCFAGYVIFCECHNIIEVEEEVEKIGNVKCSCGNSYAVVSKKENTDFNQSGIFICEKIAT